MLQGRSVWTDDRAPPHRAGRVSGGSAGSSREARDHRRARRRDRPRDRHSAGHHPRPRRAPSGRARGPVPPPRPARHHRADRPHRGHDRTGAGLLARSAGEPAARRGRGRGPHDDVPSGAPVRPPAGDHAFGGRGRSSAGLSQERSASFTSICAVPPKIVPFVVLEQETPRPLSRAARGRLKEVARAVDVVRRLGARGR